MVWIIFCNIANRNNIILNNNKMKNLTLIFAISLTAVLFTSSCKKEDNKQNNQVVNVTINENANYTYAAPTGNQGGNYTISQQASHYLSSSILPTMTASGTIYSYTPALNYVGGDQVVLSTSNSQHNGGCGGNQNGNCSHHDNHCDHHDNDDNNTITINITVVASTNK
jgi:hypothetical protein